MRRGLKGWVRRHWKLSLAVYLVLVVLQWFAMAAADRVRLAWGEGYMADLGARQLELTVESETVRAEPLTYRVATQGDLSDPSRVPALLLHGSPGGASGMTTLASELAASGRGVIWLDLPGFASQIDPGGRVYQNYSAETYAHVMRAVLDELNVERAHVVGWSNGGAVALRMIEQEPERVASLTMLASVGLQETEGSGSFAFEHGKYLAGYATMVWGARALPPLGLLMGPPAEVRAFLLNFHHTDQRELRPIMESLETPTLILHGRHDFLTPAWGAEAHHEVIPTSRLVMLDASHFIPMLQAEEAASILTGHFDRHDVPGVEPLTEYDNRAPNPTRAGAAAWIEHAGVWVRGVPWWVLVPLLAGIALHRPMLAAVLAGLFVGRVDLDIGVAWLGLVLGMLLRKRTAFESPRLWFGWLGTAWWAFASIGLVFILEQDTIRLGLGPDDLTLRFGLFGLLAWLLVGPLVLHVMGCGLRRGGRQRLAAQFARLTNHEWWPTWAIYAGLGPLWAGRLLRGESALSFTAANPGIANGGGFVGESKNAILAGLPLDPCVLPFAAIPAGGTANARAEAALQALQSRPELGGLPIILKPESGERGASVKLVRTEAAVRDYFEVVAEPVQLQRYHPGPCEFSVNWVRDVDAITGITRKVFTSVQGDGRRTLGELVLRHRRLRCQAEVFRGRHAPRWHTVLPQGESVALGVAGNHSQGCKFEDATALATPELFEAIDRLARGFVGRSSASEAGSEPRAGGLDYARFDVRSESEEAFARGEFAVIEVNGVTGEPTHLYDPTLSCRAAWRILRTHWEHLYRVADMRSAAGHRPLRASEIVSLWMASRKRVQLRSD